MRTDNIQDILDQIPIRHDIASYIMFLGIVLGLLVGILILIKTNKKNIAFKFLGVFLIAQAIISLDNFSCYTGLMKYAIAFNDSTEPLVLILGPSMYLFVYSLLTRKPITLKNIGVHLAPAIFYGLTQIGYYLHPTPVKINAYLGAYHDHLTKATIPDGTTYNYLWIKDEFRWVILGSLIIYIILSFRVLYHYLRQKNIHLTRSTLHNKYSFTRNLVLSFLTVFVIIFAVYWNFEDDSGDHYITTFVNLSVVAITLIMVSESRFFQNSWISDKYETLSYTHQEISIEKIKEFVETNGFYLLESASLKTLAQELNSSANYISQIINTSTGLNFNDFINQYRIDLCKQRLVDPEYNHLTIEAIGNSAGFKSKSSFYNAFKKHVQMSPKAFVTLQKSSF